ncbi:putative RNA-directed DNA polymerase [Helianthus annuus]|nr:putative RNA-directed DNA polymerase [Helianthus annuus]
MKVQRSSNRLYKILLKNTKPVCLLANMDDENWVWHARLGHVNFKSLEELTKKNLVEGVPHIKHQTELCEGCLISKQTRKPFPKETTWRASKPLELVHADLCGPITPQTIGGNRFFMLIVDDYCRFMWVYFLKTKDEAFSNFKKFKVKAEKNNKYKVGMLRTDRGGEFTSKEFNQYCEDQGIERQLTAPYTPQQNGVVERRNRTVMEVTRSLLKTMAVPEMFWGEAVRHAMYVLNRVSTKGFKGKTPYEGWKGFKPKLNKLKVFGCVGFIKKVGGHLDKLADRSQPLVYFGSESGSKEYRMYNPKQKRICVVREGDAEFLEGRHWAWNEAQIYQPTSQQPNWVNLKVNYEQGPSQGDVFNDATDNPNSQFSNVVSPIFDSLENNGDQGSSSWASASSSNKHTHNTTDSVASSTYDDTPFQGFRSLDDVYDSTVQIEDSGELFLIDDEPASYKEAVAISEWKTAMKSEIESIERNKTWSLVQLPAGHKAIGLKWVFKLKKDMDGNITKHKTRLVVKGYAQRKGVDFGDVFAPVARMETIRLLLAMAASGGWLLSEEVYVSQPDGFVIKGKENHIYKLNKALYGLRQAPRAWNSKLDKVLKELGFVRCKHEQAVYFIQKSDSLLIVGVYVDDIIVTGPKERDIGIFKSKMKSAFDMSDLGQLSYYLGIEVDQQKTGIILKQSAYAKKILKLAGMTECNSSKFPMHHKLKLTKEGEGKEVDPTLYRRLIGSLRYLIHTRPDISYSVGVVSRFMEKPKENHLLAVKHILRYIKGSVHYGHLLAVKHILRYIKGSVHYGLKYRSGEMENFLVTVIAVLGLIWLIGEALQVLFFTCLIT